jgi:phage/plasmid-associated DNA primase
VFEVTRKESNYDMWLNLTSGHTNLGCAVDHLTNCRDVQFPDLCKDRHVFSFQNGLYLADRDEFVEHDSVAAAMLPTALVAARYFDAEFDPHADIPPDDWAKVPTPHLQSIMDFQGMSVDVCRWLYVMIGRLIYEVGERDGWQVLPYLKGAASSGKSTILVRVCRGLYDATDVGVLSNNIERKFGLSALYDKLLFIGPEIKSDTSLEQAEFQSIVSGETVQVAAKFKTAQAVEWRVPGILAGNQVPAWVDNSGSISRRILLFQFSRRVDNGDMLLGQKLEAEMPHIILKVNRAYLQATRLHARENVWRHVPPELVSAKDELTEDVNSLVHFLRNGGLTFGSALYMPMREFKDMYLHYCRESGFKNLQMKREVYEQPLIGAGCYVSGQQTLVYRGAPTKEQFLMGASSSCGNREQDAAEGGLGLRDPLGDD